MNKIRKGNEFIKFLSIILVTVMCIGGIGFSLNSQAQTEPDNPMNGIAEGFSNVKLAAADDILPNTDYTQNIEERDQPEEEQQQKSDVMGDVYDTGNADDESLNINSEGDGKGTNDNSDHGGGGKSGGDIDFYFKTDIKNNETVTKLDYSFKIFQGNHGCEVKEQRVTVNGKLYDKFNNSDDIAVMLQEGKNDIKIEITYKKSDGTVLTKMKKYKVNADTKDLLILPDPNPDLKNCTVTEEDFSFKAYAVKGEEDAELIVTHNDTVIEPESGKYHLKLTNGDNIVKLTAKLDGEDPVIKSYKIIYNKPNSSIVIDTDLKNQEVKVPELSFYVRVTGGTNPAAVVKCNDKIITPIENGNYYVNELNKGQNYITVTASNDDEAESMRKDYIINYSANVINNDDDKKIDDIIDKNKDPNAPTITISGVENGATYEGNTRTIHIVAKDCKGNKITTDNISVYINGVPAQMLWDDSQKTSYKLNFIKGDNILTVSARDSEGRSTTVTSQFVCSPPAKGEVIGTAVISVEASTIGIPYIVAPTEVTIYQNEPFTYVIKRLLDANGITMEYKGTLDTGFYLAHLVKPGLIGEPVIPEDLKNNIESEGSKIESHFDSYSHDSLGEFDFTSGSGWMYSVNGVQPNVGFESTYLQAGDNVRVRYTLAYGADLGEGMIGETWGDW